MPWTPFGWENLPSHDTPITAEALEAFGQHIYDQVFAGGGPGPGGSDAPQSLFIGGSRPDYTELTINALWIPSATAPVIEWETSFDAGDPGTGNVRVGGPAPNDALFDTFWIPDNGLSGTNKRGLGPESWDVFAGRGADPESNNPIVFSQTLPTGLPDLTLIVRLDSDEQMRSPDTWSVFSP